MESSRYLQAQPSRIRGSLPLSSERGRFPGILWADVEAGDALAGSRSLSGADSGAGPLLAAAAGRTEGGYS